MFDGRIDLIRPLLYLHDDDLKKYSEYREFVTIQKSCPYEDATSRKDMRDVIENLKGYNKSAKLNMFNSMSKIYAEYNPSERFKFRS
jgi:tRNA(Ile)-lysidine synthase TilS/MesJ